MKKLTKKSLLRKWRLLDELIIPDAFHKIFSSSHKTLISSPDEKWLEEWHEPMYLLEELTKYHFQYPILLITVIDRYDYLGRPGCNSITFERLEFLGDAILDLITTWFAFKTINDATNECCIMFFYPTEGVNSKNTSAINESKKLMNKMASGESVISGKRVKWANNERLQKIASKTFEVKLRDKIYNVSLSQCILWKSNQRTQNMKNVADVFEAVIGAIFLDENMSAVLNNKHKSAPFWSIKNCLRFIQNHLGWDDLEKYEFSEFFENFV
ncbi:hypothetical protein RFI_07099 [Reticulomyxa filosa]|uniref:RNase III domain-containing protein n=1 Tax=Reticulomyxa filosa TaxID=46433 RepID=X6NVV5_RETFI|nr:hypothetical protein RFI_07099 [Reticulomyxa filosa]|eukprot:ETO30023.1 hypothetical protein RFI_07099 [Reticulomyxa filosa]